MRLAEELLLGAGLLVLKSVLLMLVLLLGQQGLVRAVIVTASLALWLTGLVLIAHCFYCVGRLGDWKLRLAFALSLAAIPGAALLCAALLMVIPQCLITVSVVCFVAGYVGVSVGLWRLGFIVQSRALKIASVLALVTGLVTATGEVAVLLFIEFLAWLSALFGYYAASRWGIECF